MKSIVIYNSQTGFTKKYAEWISEAAGCECVSLKKAGKINLADYDAIVFGSWCMAGSITKLKWFKKQMPVLAQAGKKLIIYMVGASPIENPDIPSIMDKMLSDEEKKMAKVFYCPGGLDYDNMKGGSKFAMKMLVKVLNSKKDATEDDKKMAEMISHSYDISDKKYVEPIISEIK
jgi:menaquinone-dependent protoporphyrinogen IX oxidase